MNNQKILLHNLSVQYMHSNNELFDFDQNALFFANPGDVIVTRKKIPERYIAFLSGCGFDFEGVTFISSQNNASSNMKDIFFDESIISQLHSVIDRKRNPTLDCFILTEYEAEWAKKLDIAYEGKPEHEIFGGKSAFRSLVKKHGFSLARGFENQNNVLDGTLKVAWLLSTGFSEVVIKYDEGVAALGSRRFTREEFLTEFSSFEHFLSSRSSQGVAPKYSQNFVIEGWHDDVLYSPSIQLLVLPNGAVELVSTHTQLFYENKMRYKGCLSSHFIEEDVQKNLVTTGIALATVFADKGYCGHLAFNAILLPDKKLLWEELNPRRVMSSYPFQIRKKIFGEKADEISYVSKHVQKSNWKEKSIEDMLALLSPVLFSCEKNSGIVPFDYSLLSVHGRLSLVAFATSKEATIRLLEYVECL